jgi:Flp pilus assembly protein TadB
MYWIVSVQLIFGIAFANRTLENLRQRKLISEFDVKWKCLLLFVMFFCVTALAQHHPFIQMIAILLCCSLLLALPSLFMYRLRRRIQSEFPVFLDKIILEMKCGHSFRGALDRHLGPSDEFWQQWLRSMIETRVLLQQIGVENDTWWTPYLRELKAAEQNPHLALTHLENFREKLCVLSEFRRKSGQAMLQARIQMLVMAVLYLALLAITAMRAPIQSHRRTLFMSLCLFVTGQIVFWWAGRKRTWKT